MVSFDTLIFLLVLALGGSVLWYLNRPRLKTPPTTSAVVHPQRDLVEELLGGEALSPAARREWLDRLLAAQQQDSDKK